MKRAYLRLCPEKRRKKNSGSKGLKWTPKFLTETHLCRISGELICKVIWFSLKIIPVAMAMLLVAPSHKKYPSKLQPSLWFGSVFACDACTPRPFSWTCFGVAWRQKIFPLLCLLIFGAKLNINIKVLFI